MDCLGAWIVVWLREWIVRQETVALLVVLAGRPFLYIFSAIFARKIPSLKKRTECTMKHSDKEEVVYRVSTVPMGRARSLVSAPLQWRKEFCCIVPHNMSDKWIVAWWCEHSNFNVKWWIERCPVMWTLWWQRKGALRVFQWKDLQI